VLICGVAILHIANLHKNESSSGLGIASKESELKLSINPAYVERDYVSIIVAFFAFLLITCYAPEYFGHPDNNIPGNNLVTPLHIVPE